MMRTEITATVFIVLSAFVASDLHAQGGKGRAGRGGGTYDPKTVETISGEVVRIEQISGTARQGRKGGGYGLHLLLKTDNAEIPVHLGPGWYVEKQALTIAPKDRIEVRGSRILIDGKPALIAAEVKKGDQVLKLRDENGVPVWSGQGRRGS